MKRVNRKPDRYFTKRVANADPGTLRSLDEVLSGVLDSGRCGPAMRQRTGLVRLARLARETLPGVVVPTASGGLRIVTVEEEEAMENLERAKENAA